MSQRIHLNPNRGQAPFNQGYTPDPIATPGSRSTGPRSENEIVAQIQEVSSKIEDAIEQYTQVRLRTMAPDDGTDTRSLSGRTFPPLRASSLS